MNCSLPLYRPNNKIVTVKLPMIALLKLNSVNRQSTNNQMYLLPTMGSQSFYVMEKAYHLRKGLLCGLFIVFMRIRVTEAVLSAKFMDFIRIVFA